MSASVTIVVVSWNALPLLKRCLPSVAATEWPNLEVVLADNGSDDGSAEWVAEHLPSVRIIRHPENWGFCRGNNEAVRQTDGDFVVLLNNDVEVPPDWLAPLVARAQSDARIGAVQPKLLQYDHRERFEYAGACGGFLDRFGYPFARGRLFFTLERDDGQYDDPADVFWGSGAALLLRRRALDETGLLDERFEFHMEEIDLCWRLLRARWRVVSEPGSTVYHIGGGSLPYGNPRKTYYNFRNSLLMLYKNLPSRHWWRLFPIRIVLDGVAMLRSLVTGGFRDAWAVVRAYADAHRMKGTYRDQRPTGPADFPHYRGSIVFDYFARGRKRFSDLPTDRFSPPLLRASDDLNRPPADRPSDDGPR